MAACCAAPRSVAVLHISCGVEFAVGMVEFAVGMKFLAIAECTLQS